MSPSALLYTLLLTLAEASQEARVNQKISVVLHSSVAPKINLLAFRNIDLIP